MRNANPEADRPSAQALAARARGLVAAWGIDRARLSIRVMWNPRLRTTAGRARVRGQWIELNPHLLGQDGTAQELLAEVLAHEAAHLAAVVLYGPKIEPHGREWQALMAATGLPARACHGADVRHLRRRTG